MKPCGSESSTNGGGKHVYQTHTKFKIEVPGPQKVWVEIRCFQRQCEADLVGLLSSHLSRCGK